MSEYLSEEEQIAQLKSWWGEYGNAVIVGLVLAVGGLVGWQWYGSHKQNQSLTASAKFIEYQAAQGDDQAALAQEIREAFPGSAYDVFVLLDQSQQAVGEGDLQSAADALSRLVDTADEPLLADLARIRLAKVQRALDRKEAALATLSAIRHEGYRSWALETKGDIHAAADEVELAHLAYQAATEALSEGEQRPLLKMKLDNTAPFEGEYVQLSDPLSDALREARESLEANENLAEPDVQDAVSEAAEEGLDELGKETEEIEQIEDDVPPTAETSAETNAETNEENDE